MRDSNLKALACVASSPIRERIVLVLHEQSLSFSKLHNEVCKALGLTLKDVSDGSYTWHLDKLRLAGVIEGGQSKHYELTYLGRMIGETIAKSKLVVDVRKQQ